MEGSPCQLKLLEEKRHSMVLLKNILKRGRDVYKTTVLEMKMFPYYHFALLCSVKVFLSIQYDNNHGLTDQVQSIDINKVYFLESLEIALSPRVRGLLAGTQPKLTLYGIEFCPTLLSNLSTPQSVPSFIGQLQEKIDKSSEITGQ